MLYFRDGCELLLLVSGCGEDCPNNEEYGLTCFNTEVKTFWIIINRVVNYASIGSMSPWIVWGSGWDDRNAKEGHRRRFTTHRGKLVIHCVGIMHIWFQNRAAVVEGRLRIGFNLPCVFLRLCRWRSWVL